MESDAPLTADQARSALAELDTGRTAAARRVVTPWWFHPLLGLAFAAMIGAFSLRGPAVVAVVAASLVAQLVLYVVYRRLTGLWVNTWHVEGMQRPTALATGVSLVVAYGTAVLDMGLGVRGAAALGGVVLGVAYVVYWRWVDRRLAELWTAAP